MNQIISACQVDRTKIILQDNEILISFFQIKKMSLFSATQVHQ